MPRYKYSAKKNPGEITHGTIEAASQENAIELINSMGYFAVSVELEESSDKECPSVETISFSPGKVKLREIIMFFGQLARLLRAGIPIQRALSIIAEETANRRFQAVVNYIRERVKSGDTLSGAMSCFPSVFSPLYIALVKTGENSGSLTVVLERLGQYLRKHDEFISKIKIALIYPLFMIFVGAITIIFMLVVVIPKVKNLYIGMGEELPIPTKILIAASGYIINNSIWIVLAILIIFLALKAFMKRRPDVVSAVKLTVPLYGKLVLKSELVRLLSSLELSLKNGVGVLRAIELALPVSGNEIIKKELRKAYAMVKEGQSFGENLKASKLFPVLMSNMIIIGEESGRLDEMLSEISDYFQRDSEDTLKIFTAQFEPLMILIIGLILGYIVIAVLLPIFQINLIAK